MDNSMQISQAYQDGKAIIFDVAKGYVEHGLQVVCVHSALCTNKVKRGKAPSHSGWQQDALSWPQLRGEMERIWSKEGGVNIGVRTGKQSGIVCIDIDEKSGGLAWYYENELHLGRPIIERTGGKGLHLYYRYPHSRVADGQILRTRSSGGRLFKGVDLLADGAAQVVTWPSLHGATGIEYKFDNSLSLLDVQSEADELPGWLVDLLVDTPATGHESNEEVKGSSDGADLVDIQQAILFLRGYPAAIQGDGGDLTTLRAAMVCKDYGLNFSQVFDVMATEYNPRCTPPWSPDELRSKIRNAFKYGKNKPGINSMESMFPQSSSDVVSAANSVATTADAAVKISAAKTYSKKNPVHSANLFVERHQEVLRCFNDDWYLYDADNCHWTRINDARVEAMIYADFAKVTANGQTLMTARASLFPDIRKLAKIQMNQAVKTLPINQWLDSDLGGEFIAFENGLLNLKTRELTAHSSKLFNFTVLPFAYEAKAECPTFLKFLQDVWDGDEELIDSLRLWFGYVMLPTANAQRFALFQGASRGGKSTLVNVLSSLVGKRNVAWPTVSGLSGEFGLQSIVGCRLVVIPEADKIGRDKLSIAAERIKCIASNDVLEINRKGETFLYQQLDAKLVVVCNDMPQFVNQQGSLTNRMVVFPFWKSYQGKEDLQLIDKLEMELAGIFNWALSGSQELLNENRRLFTAMRGVVRHQQITEQLSDIDAFMADIVEFVSDDSGIIVNDNLWSVYKTWCKECNRHCKNRQHFLTMLAQHPDMITRRVVRRVGTKIFRGYTRLRLLDPLMPPPLEMDGVNEPDDEF